MENIYIIKGENIYDLTSFFNEFARAVNAPNGYFDCGLLQFEDCLFGGFGLEAPCKIIWKNSSLSKQRLNYKILKDYYVEENDYNNKELVKELKEFFDHGRADATEKDCYFYSRIVYSSSKIEKAINKEMDMFDEIVETIRLVSERSFNKDWKIELILE